MAYNVLLLFSACLFVKGDFQRRWKSNVILYWQSWEIFALNVWLVFLLHSFCSFKVLLVFAITSFNFKWISNRKVTWSISWTLHFIHHCSFLHLRPWQSGVCYISYVSITAHLIFLCSLFINPEDVAPPCKCLLIRQLLFSMKFYTPSLFVPQGGIILYIFLFAVSCQHHIKWCFSFT